jgi:hypothetical protein
VQFLRYAFVIAVTWPAFSYAADDLGIERLFGHDVSITGPFQDEVLKVDGREIHKNASVSLDEITLVNGMPVAIGSSSMGGNACDSAYFVLSFPQGAAPRFDGPAESCHSTSYELRDTEILVSTGNIPGEGQTRWRWTPEQGFQSLEKFAFKPDENTGWEILRERQLNHPGQLLFNGVISALLKSMVGARFDEYQRALNGVGSGEFENDDWYAQSCTPHMCTDEEVIVFLSGHDRKVFTAWKPPGEKILVWPVLNEWPEKAKSHLRAWAKKWK